MSTDPAAQKLLVLLFTDLADASGLKMRLGMPAFAALLRRHNALFEETAREAAPAARVIKHTGNGYFASFATASDAVRFALTFQRRIHAADFAPAGAGEVRARIGIHLGQVDLVVQAGQEDVVGLSADVTARVMSLALPGQILLSRPAFDDARLYVRDPSPDPSRGDSDGDEDHDSHARAAVRWLAHGPYLFKGNPDPLEVFEVGEDGVAPLAPPPDGEKARRIVRHDEEPVYGWRPGAGDRVPSKPRYVLERKLGEGGFGEVWLARHDKLREQRVLKFCFDADRLRSLKREFVLFRLIKEALGERPDIARLYDYNLDEPPFFLESEYTAGGDLADWAAARGGIAAVPLSDRLEIVARVCDAVAAAHSVGILHKDIKPSNVLMHVPQQRPGEPPEVPQPRLSDFGIGFIADRSRLARHNITETGFTQITEAAGSSTHTAGTRMYAPPESVTNQPFTTQGDVYALGVLLYQMAVGDLTRPLTTEWPQDLADPLLREDIADATARDPARRPSARSLAQRLRDLPARRERAETEARRLRRAARRRRAVTAAVATAAVLLLMLALSVYFLLGERALRQRAETAEADAVARQKVAEQQRALAARASAKAEQATLFLVDTLSAADPARSGKPDVTVREVLRKASEGIRAKPPADEDLRATLDATLGRAFFAIGLAPESAEHTRRAIEVARRTMAGDPVALGDLLMDLHSALSRSAAPQDERFAVVDEALKLYRGVLPPGDGRILRAEGERQEADRVATGRIDNPRDRFLPIWLKTVAFTRGETEDQTAAFVDTEIKWATREFAAGNLDGVRARIRELYKPFFANPLLRPFVPTGIGNFARHQVAIGDVAGAEPLLYCGLWASIDLHGERHAETALLQSIIGMYYLNRFDANGDRVDLTRADEWLSRALETGRPLVAPTDLPLLQAETNHLRTLVLLGDAARALALADGVEAKRASVPAEFAAVSRIYRGWALGLRGERDAGTRAIAEGVNEWIRVPQGKRRRDIIAWSYVRDIALEAAAACKDDRLAEQIKALGSKPAAPKAGPTTKP